MNLETLFPCALLLLGCLYFIFRPEARGAMAGPVREKTRVDYLQERKEVIYDNLRDLNFEYRAGKFPEEDFARQRDALEAEAAQVLGEIESLGGSAEPSATAYGR